jgi:hypothetical protein
VLPSESQGGFDVYAAAIIAVLFTAVSTEWTTNELEQAVVEQLRGDGVELPPRMLKVHARGDSSAGSGWRILLRSDDGERRWRDVESLPRGLSAAATTVRMVVLELLAPVPSISVGGRVAAPVRSEAVQVRSRSGAA